MLEFDHLELQQNTQEPLTRPKLKRLIFEYLQKRSRKEILDEISSEGHPNPPDQGLWPLLGLEIPKIVPTCSELLDFYRMLK